jgi:predicted SnoaL-like aldol condensation-catalyzing enzyme
MIIPVDSANEGLHAHIPEGERLMKKFLLAFALSVLVTAPLYAQRAKLSSAEEANKKVVFEFYRQVWETGNADLLRQFYAADFKEHNPAVPPGGLDGLARFLKMRFPTVKPAGKELQNPPALVQVDGDLVTWTFKREAKDPKDGSAYDSYWFDTYRVKDGKVIEHWDAATRQAPPAAR